MAVYPFYISTQASGRKTEIAGGTKSKKGYMETTVYQRDKGQITTPFKIVQRSIEVFDDDGKYSHQELRTEVYYEGELIKSHSTIY